MRKTIITLSCCLLFGIVQAQKVQKAHKHVTPPPPPPAKVVKTTPASQPAKPIGRKPLPPSPPPPALPPKP